MTVTARLTDSAGAPLLGAHVAIEARHNSRANRVLTAALEPRDVGYGAAMPLGRTGLWEFRVRVTRGPDVFTATLMRDVPEIR